MVGVIRDQLPDGGLRSLDRLGGRGIGVSQHVDRGIGEIQRREPGPDEQGTPAGLLQGAGGDERRQPRTDHGDIGLHR